MRIATGDRLGDYTIIGVVEAGRVYLGVHLTDGRRVVIEVGVGLRDVGVSHPAIARVVDRGPGWRAAEVVDGVSLYDALARRPSVVEVAAIVRDVAEVLAAVHERGASHGALTIGSITLEPLSIRDWGGRRGDEPNVFQAPEGGSFEAAADIYALGVIAYRALTGVFLPLVVVDVPGALGGLVLRMLAHDPEARPRASVVRSEAAAVATPRFSRPKWTPPTHLALVPDDPSAGLPTLPRRT